MKPAGTQTLTLMICAALIFGLGGCGTEGHDHAHGYDHDHDHDHGHNHHHHVAPHGGVLHEIGEHFAQLEFVLDAETGTLTMYVLDGCAENAIRLSHETIDLTVTPDDGESLALQLDAVASPLTGETVGNSSQFYVRSDALIGVEKLRGRIASITIRGQTVEHVEVLYPEGYHSHHHH